jgi:hypothetical protein
VLTEISEDLNIPRYELAPLGACSCIFQPSGKPTDVFISARVSEFWLFCVSANIEMADVKEQGICIKFCFQLNKTAAETHLMPKEAFGDQALNQVRTFEWFKRFKDGRESVEDATHAGRPATCTTPEMIAKVREVILEDRRSTMFVITLDCHTSHVNAFQRMN